MSLPSSHARSRARFAAAAALEHDLRARVRGKVAFDPATRALFAADASNYRHVPIAVVQPLDSDDVEAAVECCRRHQAPVLPRGAGTSIAGQSCNVAVVLDFTRHMHRLLALDPDARRARVQPGLVLDRLRGAAEAHGLTFAPDPATHSRCTLGGMIGNNSCGVHSIYGGKTVDNLAALEVLLYDGTRLALGAGDPGPRLGREAALYAGLRDLAAACGEDVRQSFPRLPRRVSGYNLDQLLPESGFHVARALVGSEGTCATVLEATLDLRPSPPSRVLVGAGFLDVATAADHVPEVLLRRPIGLEGLDGLLLDYMRRKRLLLRDLELIPEGRGTLLIEFGDWDPGAAAAAAETCAQWLRTQGAAARVYSAAEAARVWHVRESGLGATAFVPGRPHGWEGWEDAAVAPDRLGNYLREFARLMTAFGYEAPMYGHFGDGCVHMRIDFDLESAAGIAKFRQFLDAAADLVVTHGGSLSGEHGDGQARAALWPKMFSPRLMRAMAEFKHLWDPDSGMNPGKLIDAHAPDEDLRFGADYQPWRPPTHFAFAADQGSFAHAASRCVGVGACLKTDRGAMCPSYMVTREEQYSTRGRAHLLWEMMQGEVLPAVWDNPAIKAALDLCLACKACARECPVGVDMARYKAEFLSHYFEHHRRPQSAVVLGHLDRWLRFAGRAPALANRLAGLGRPLMGLHPERTLPRVQAPFTRQRRPEPAPGPPVLLWPDTFNNSFHPQTLAAAESVLSAAGFSVLGPAQSICCGRPLYDLGLLDRARRYLSRVVEVLAPQLDAGTPIVILEPSCASVLRDELIEMLPGNPRAARLAAQSFLLSEFLVHQAPGFVPPRLAGERLLVHGHCHHHAVMTLGDEMALLQATGAEAELLDSGCCGMAGAFGFERDNYEISVALAERVLLPRLRAAPPGTRLVAEGFSCREQVRQAGFPTPLHLADLLAEKLTPGAGR